MNSKMLHMVSWVLLLIGGINWLLTAFDYNVVEMILGTGMFTTVVYVLVGLSAIYELMTHKGRCTACNTP